MDLSTNYLGLRLPHPLMPGASPLADSLDTVKRLEDAGAAAIVLRSLFEQRTVEILRSVKKVVTIPVAVKLSPFFSSVAHLAHQLDEAGADGLVLFNRFYQPDIDIEALEAVPSLHLSDSSELLLRIC